MTSEDREFRIRLRRGTDAQWASTNPILLSGELGYVTDLKRYKIGDGSTRWIDLPYHDQNNATFVVSDVEPENPTVGLIWIPAP